MQNVTSPDDILVVGAGVIGCAVASELARRGAAVTLIDDRPAGMGATQASAGVLAPYIEAREGGPLLELAARGLDLFDECVARVTSATGLSVAYQRSGTIDVALGPASVRALLETRDALSQRGVAAEWLDAPTVRGAEPQLSADSRGGLLIPAHGYVAAADLARALVAEARASGATVVDCGRAVRIARQGARFTVSAERGPVSAGAVVLAAGSWAGQIDIEGVKTPLPVRPVRGQLLHLAWSGPLLNRVIWGERCYIVPWRDRTVLVGATVEDVGFDERTTVAGIRSLMEAVCELVPAASAASLTSARVGLRPGTPDGLPIIGASTTVPNLMYAIGHYRNGILLAPLTAALVADAMLEGKTDPLLAFTSPVRFGDL